MVLLQLLGMAEPGWILLGLVQVRGHLEHSPTCSSASGHRDDRGPGFLPQTLGSKGRGLGGSTKWQEVPH